MELDEIIWRCVEYFKDTREYEFTDNYESDEEAFKELKKLGIPELLHQLYLDIDTYIGEDLTIKDLEDRYDEACILIKLLNKYAWSHQGFPGV